MRNIKKGYSVWLESGDENIYVLFYKKSGEAMKIPYNLQFKKTGLMFWCEINIA